MHINLDPWFMIGASLFGLSSLVYIIRAWLDSKPELSRRSLDVSLIFWALLLVCWLFHTGGQGASRLWFGMATLAIGLAYRSLRSKINFSSLGAMISALLSLLAIFSYQLGLSSSARVVQSEGFSWSLSLHIALATAGLVAFSVSSAMSGVYLFVSKQLKSKKLIMGSNRLPSLSALDSLHLKSLLIGFPLYTAALLIGSAHAFRGNGHISFSYMVAITSWLIYGAVLQARLTAGWRGRRAAFLTLIAFVGLLGVAASYSFR